MYVSKGYSNLINRLNRKERRNGTDIPITIGILIADCRDPFARRKIFDCLSELNIRSGPLIDFYIPGYAEIKIPKSADQEVLEQHLSRCDFRFNGKFYSFDEDEFYGAINQFEEHEIKITGRTQLPLLPYKNGTLCFKEAAVFDLEKDEQSEIIESVKLFFDLIFDISKETTNIDEFRNRIMLDKTKRAAIKFIKGHAVDALKDISTILLGQ